MTPKASQTSSRARSPRKKTQTYSQLKKRLDSVFGAYVRKRDLGQGCISCGGSGGQHQAGHFISRVRLSTRWDERNVNAQCGPCNIWRRGNSAEYAVALRKKYGPQVIEELVDKSHQPLKLSKSDLLSRIEEYQAKLEALA